MVRCQAAFWAPPGGDLFHLTDITLAGCLATV